MNVSWMTGIVAAGRRKLSLKRRIRRLAGEWSPADTILLDYPVKPKCRWPIGRPHPELWRILNANRDAYADLLRSFLPFGPRFANIPKDAKEAGQTEPYWINGWMPALDGVALYALTALNKPKRYFEVGSGNSTKFAARAVKDHGLATRIVSIDPEPRAEIDQLCEKIIRAPVEDVDVAFFDELECNDILYIDNSHRAFMNSDATVLLLDVLPRLKPGVIVHVHDVTLPYDYPEAWAGRFYSEQYLLACYLLALGTRFEVLLPSSFVSFDEQLKGIMDPLWGQEFMRGVETHGCSFWLRMR
jgi:predicted O-methyltransferase YrrM